MEFLIRAVATAAIVALVLLAARRFGHRAAGVLAGLPFTTVPALGWTAAAGGTDLAARVAIGTVAGCILVPLFAMAYDRTARRSPPGRSLVAGLAAVACGVALMSRMPATLAIAVFMCAVAGLAALQTLRVPQSVRIPATATPCSPTSIAIGVALVGIISAAIAALSTVTTPQFAGLLAGVPTLGLVTIVRLHGTQGNACVTPFLRGYVISTLGRVLFGTVFALTAVPAGSTAAMLVAIAAGASFCVAASCIDGRRLSGRGQSSGTGWAPIRWPGCPESDAGAVHRERRLKAAHPGRHGTSRAKT